VVLILDDVHVLHDRECGATLSVLAEHVPDASGLVLADRAQPPLRVARLRAEGRIVEIGPRELALTAGEASVLLRHAGLTLGEEDMAVLHQRTEGWRRGGHGSPGRHADASHLPARPGRDGRAVVGVARRPRRHGK
jgi:LuxR family transcriptional regulator, maltose regulon positive regulatory protein